MFSQATTKDRSPKAVKVLNVTGFSRLRFSNNQRETHDSLSTSPFSVNIR